MIPAQVSKDQNIEITNLNSFRLNILGSSWNSRQVTSPPWIASRSWQSLWIYIRSSWDYLDNSSSLLKSTILSLPENHHLGYSVTLSSILGFLLQCLQHLLLNIWLLATGNIRKQSWQNSSDIRRTLAPFIRPHPLLGEMMQQQGPPSTLFSALGSSFNSSFVCVLTGCEVACLDPRSDPREVFGLQANGETLWRWLLGLWADLGHRIGYYSKCWRSRRVGIGGHCCVSQRGAFRKYRHPPPYRYFIFQNGREQMWQIVI